MWQADRWGYASFFRTAVAQRRLNTALGGMRVLFAVSILLGGCSSGDVIVSSVALSPDGNRVAAAYVEMGGGAAGYCHMCVDVFAPAFEVSEAECRRDQQWFSCSATVDLAWTSERQVIATYTGDPKVTPVLQEQAAPSDTSVSIVYRASR